MNDSDDQEVAIVYMVTGTLSVIGSLLIIISFIAIPQLRKRELMQMVFWMSVSDLLFCLKFWLPSITGTLAEDGDPEPPFISCFSQFIAGQFFAMASITWYACIAYNTYLSIWDAFGRRGASLRVRYHMVVWGTALTTTVAVIIWPTNETNYGLSGDGTCWIKPSWLRLFFFGPLMIYMCGALLLLLLVIRRRHMLSFGAPNRLLARMVAFVTIFVCVWIWPLILRAHEILSDGSYNHVLVMIHATMISGQGAGNFCVWITSPAFNDFFARLRRTCKCCAITPLHNNEFRSDSLASSLLGTTIASDGIASPRTHSMPHVPTFLTPTHASSSSSSLLPSLFRESATTTANSPATKSTSAPTNNTNTGTDTRMNHTGDHGHGHGHSSNGSINGISHGQVVYVHSSSVTNDSTMRIGSPRVTIGRGYDYGTNSAKANGNGNGGNGGNGSGGSDVTVMQSQRHISSPAALGHNRTVHPSVNHTHHRAIGNHGNGNGNGGHGHGNRVRSDSDEAEEAEANDNDNDDDDERLDGRRHSLHMLHVDTQRTLSLARASQPLSLSLSYNRTHALSTPPTSGGNSSSSSSSVINTNININTSVGSRGSNSGSGTNNGSTDDGNSGMIAVRVHAPSSSFVGTSLVPTAVAPTPLSSST